MYQIQTKEKVDRKGDNLKGDNLKKLYCKDCGESFTFRSNLSRHRKLNCHKKEPIADNVSRNIRLSIRYDEKIDTVLQLQENETSQQFVELQEKIQQLEKNW